MAVGRPFKVNWEEEEETLYELYKKEKDLQMRKRLQALWLLRKGERLGEVAKIVGVKYRTVQEWVRRYRQGGLEEVKKHRIGSSGGVKARLEGENLAKLEEEIKAGKFKTIWEAVEWVKEEIGIEYSYWGMRWVFKRLKVKKKSPAPKTQKHQRNNNKNGKKVA